MLSWTLCPGGVDEKQIAVMGGSHGGLLTGHLVGQHPSRFRCASLRNPVMDVSAMIHLSDIPDWCYVEAWGIEVCLAALLCRAANAWLGLEPICRRPWSAACHPHKCMQTMLPAHA